MAHSSWLSYHRGMAYPRRLLTEGEEVVTQFRPHWRLLFIPAVRVVLAIAVAIAAWLIDFVTVINWIITGIAVGVVLWWGVRQFISWWFTSYVLTSERLIRRSGVLARRGIEISLENINDMQFSQTILERLLRGGDLLIESAGQHGQSRFRDIREPELFQSELYKAREGAGRRPRG